MVYEKSKEKSNQNALYLFYHSRAKEFYDKFDKWNDKTKFRLYKEYLLGNIGAHDSNCDDWNGTQDCDCEDRIEKKKEKIQKITKVDNLDYNILKVMIPELEEYHYDSVKHIKDEGCRPVQCNCADLRAKIIEIKLEQLKKDYNIK